MDTITETAEAAPPPASSAPLPAPPASRPQKTKRAALPRPDHCLNCWHRTGGNFCANCGQENEDETVALKLLVADFLSDLASFDSRLFRTLVPLLFRPGFLTNEYNAGRRVRYLSPFKLYLTMSVLFFVLLPLTHPDDLHVNENLPSASRQAAVKQANAATKDSGVNINIGTSDTRDNIVSIGHQKYDLSRLPKTVEEYDARQRDPHYPHDSRARQYLSRQIIKARQSPQSVLQALLDDIPKVMFLLLPCFALSLKVLYLRSRRLYIEHLIFALHLHAFVFLLLSLALLIHSSLLGVAIGFFLLAYPLIAMRVVYKQSWLKTGIKYSLLGFNYVFLLTFTLLGAVAAAFLLV